MIEQKFTVEDIQQFLRQCDMPREWDCVVYDNVLKEERTATLKDFQGYTVELKLKGQQKGTFVEHYSMCLTVDNNKFLLASSYGSEFDYSDEWKDFIANKESVKNL